MEGATMADLDRINNTLGKMAYYLGNHNSICVSVSGGSDSDVIVHLIAKHFPEYLSKIHFVFADTGVEYQATYEHLDYLKRRYGIEIETVRGMPIPIAVRTYGIPFISKRVSDYLGRLLKKGFNFEENPFYEDYKGCRVGLRWWKNDFGEKSRFNIERNRGLKEFLINKKPNIAISCKCCEVSKKEPLKKFQKKVKADLIITGERKSEGGSRAGAHKSCFETNKGIDRYMPLWFWDNETKEYYKAKEGIVNSDCYEVYGMRRTGCVGCPFSLKRAEELEIIQKYEPKLYKACMNIFGESYRLTDEYNAFRNKSK